MGTETCETGLSIKSNIHTTILTPWMEKTNRKREITHICQKTTQKRRQDNQHACNWLQNLLEVSKPSVKQSPEQRKGVINLGLMCNGVQE